MYGQSEAGVAGATAGMLGALPFTGANVGDLPFTGLNIAWVVVFGMTLIAIGLALLRLVPRAER
jgi:hypothetical protein